MSQTLSVDQQLATAQHYFQSRAAQTQLLGAAAPMPTGNKSVPQMFQPNGSTTGSVMQFNGTLPQSVTAAQLADFSDLLQQQQFYLQSGIGLVTAFVTNTFQNDPKSWANPVNWLKPLSALPAAFYIPTDITQYKFQQSIRGTQIATSIMNVMVGWVSDAGVASAFSAFLSTIGRQISEGVQNNQASMDAYNISLGYQPVMDSAGNWSIISTADYYFISFNASNRLFYSSCESAQAYDFELNYQKGTLLLDWTGLSSNVNVQARKQWDAIVQVSALDDLTKARNFFSTKAISNYGRI